MADQVLVHYGILHITQNEFILISDTDIKVFKPEDIFGKYPSIFSKVPDDVKMKFIKTIESKVVTLNISFILCIGIRSAYASTSCTI